MAARTGAELMRVLQFGDSTLPVGAFAFSNGLESALQTGVVRDIESLKRFVQAATGQAARIDGVALLAAHRAALAGDFAAVLAADRALSLRRTGEEQRSMSMRMGKKLGQLATGLFEDTLLRGWLHEIEANRTAGFLAVGHALIFAANRLPELDAFVAHQYGVAQMMLGAALRLMRVDHYTTQRLLFEVNAGIDKMYLQVKDVRLEDAAGFCPVFDVLVAHHVGAHVRMFMN